MIILDTPLAKLEAVLSGSVTANQLEINSYFFDQLPQAQTTLTRSGRTAALTNNTSDVTMVAAPGLVGIRRNIHTISVHNKDTASATVTVKIDDGGTERILVKQRLNAGDSLNYEHGAGWTFTSPSTSPYFEYRIQGLTWSNNAGDSTNDIDIAVGFGRDSTNALDIVLSAALTKQSDASWTVGTNQGGLDTGAIGNNDYYIWLIKRSDTGVVDALFSLSQSSPTMPTGYDYKRLIGWFKRVGGSIVAFHTYELEGGGIEMKWNTPTVDISLSNALTTARRTDAVKVPLNFTVVALLRVFLADAASGFSVVVCCPDETDAAPSTSATPLANFRANTNATQPAGDIAVRTSNAGLIASRSDLATVDTYLVVTLGFIWARRN